MATEITEKPLAQVRPNSTDKVVVYQPNAGTIAIVKFVMVTNTTGSAATYSIYHDFDGTDFSESNMLVPTVTLPANNAEPLTVYWVINADGALGVDVGTAGAITFSFYGAEIK